MECFVWDKEEKGKTLTVQTVIFYSVFAIMIEVNRCISVWILSVLSDPYTLGHAGLFLQPKRWVISLGYDR